MNLLAFILLAAALLVCWFTIVWSEEAAYRAIALLTSLILSCGLALLAMELSA